MLAEHLVYKLVLKTRLQKSKNGPFNSDLAKIVENTSLYFGYQALA